MKISEIRLFKESDRFFIIYHEKKPFSPWHHHPEYEFVLIKKGRGKRMIGDHLWWSPYVNEDDVQVSVSDGTATLTGIVDTRREKLYAEINAMKGGAEEINNNLIVEYGNE